MLRPAGRRPKSGARRRLRPGPAGPAARRARAAARATTRSRSTRATGSSRPAGTSAAPCARAAKASSRRPTSTATKLVTDPPREQRDEQPCRRPGAAASAIPASASTSERQRLVHGRQHQVVEPGLAAARDLVLARASSPRLPTMPLVSPRRHVREDRREQHDRRGPERARQAEPGAEAQAERPASRHHASGDEGGERERRRHQRQRPRLRAAGAVEVGRVPALRDVDERRPGTAARSSASAARGAPPGLSRRRSRPRTARRGASPAKKCRSSRPERNAVSFAQKLTRLATAASTKNRKRGSRLQVAQRAVHPEQAEERHGHVVPRVAAVEEDATG